MTPRASGSANSPSQRKKCSRASPPTAQSNTSCIQGHAAHRPEGQDAMNTVVVILLAIVGGIAVTVQGQFMGFMTQLMGPRESMFITYASGGIVVTLLLLATG